MCEDAIALLHSRLFQLLFNQKQVLSEPLLNHF